MNEFVELCLHESAVLAEEKDVFGELVVVFG